MASDNKLTGLEIAIIGMAGRFPGAGDLRRFWQNLAEGRECISFFAEEELLASGLGLEEIRRPGYVKARGILEDCESFDAGFFRITPREAEFIDPQQRLFLECAWEAFEDAGYVPDAFAGLIGVFAAVATSTYFFWQIIPAMGSGFAFSDAMSILSNDKDFLPTRLSYKLNLRGPSVAVGTGCSSSLVATHIACKSLLAGECDMALAGGVSIHFPIKSGYNFQEGGVVSPDGHCRTFDECGKGSVFGSGIGVVLLKRLEDALKDRDPIYAVIKGSATNNDGSRRVGFTAPSIEGQSEVIALARLMAGVDASSISYIETHGTATPIGDPIEVQALIEASANSPLQKNSCAIGSVKTNIGHTAEASGIAGLIKTALSLRHRKIPASLHFTKPNPKLGLEDSPFYVNDKLKDWKSQGPPLRAGVSSFGIGGTNAHVVLEEAPQTVVHGSHRKYSMLTLSARTASALETYTDQIRTFLSENPIASLPDAAFTLQTGRKSFDYRRVLVCDSVDDAVQSLKGRDRQRIYSSVRPPLEAPNIAIMFSGLGDDHPGMAATLYQTEPFFRTELDRCFELLKQELNVDFRTILRVDSASANTKTSAVNNGPDLRRMLGRAGRTNGTPAERMRTDFAQIALFITELALARLWMHWGLKPKALIGYSLGEFSAACVAGVFSVPDAIKIVAARAKLVQSLPPGAMLAVPLPEQEVRELKGAELGVAAINGPALTVLSGPVESIAELQSRLKSKGIETRHVHTSHALHSHAMAPITEAFMEVLKQFPTQPPQIPYVSNVTGDWIKPEEPRDPAYWARHLCGTVRFGAGVEKLRQNGTQIFVEAGPGQTLCSLVLQHPACHSGERAVALQSLSSIYDAADDSAVLLSSLGKLWLEGWTPDWESFHEQDRRSRMWLPTYPFERKVYRVQPVGTSIGIPKTAFAIYPQPASSQDKASPQKSIAAALETNSQTMRGIDDDAAEGEQLVLPETELQRKVAALWYELLGIEQISIHDNFFKIGGDSLLGTRLISRLSGTFPIELPLRQLIENPTIASLSEIIEGLLLQKLEELSDEEAAKLAENLG
ncbi:MAG: polyketide synthase [Candidatus Angelobacter sp. Gp1-AA117]|nr:MAG: polyketide synthase [Candidatus Angelobacter sp. Gp1-AA117]